MPRDLPTFRRRATRTVAAWGLATLAAWTLPSVPTATAAEPSAGGATLPGTAHAIVKLEPGPVTPSPSPSTSATPTFTPNPRSPFAETIGGAKLGGGGIVADPKAATPPPDVDVESYVVADLDSGAVLAAKNAHIRLPPASTLKTLTADALLPRLDKRARYTAVQADADVEGSKVGIVARKVYTIDQLFYGLFLPSGNDAAHALANASGGMAAAVRLMNAEAERLGAFDTHAVSTSGLDAPGQVSSAYDLALFAREGMANPDFKRYATTQRYNFPGKAGKSFQIQNGNQLLREYPGAIGVKNGYTTKAHNTLVGAAERDGHRIVVSLMRTDAPSWEKAAALLDWGFSVADAAKPVGTLVTTRDVARAAATKAARVPADPAGVARPQSPTPEGAKPAAPLGAAPTPAAQVNVVPEALQRLPAWIWLAAALFTVLAGMRVYTYVRAHRPPTV